MYKAYHKQKLLLGEYGPRRLWVLSCPRPNCCGPSAAYLRVTLPGLLIFLIIFHGVILFLYTLLEGTRKSHCASP